MWIEQIEVKKKVRSLIWAIFFYRGGPAEMGFDGYFIVLLVIGFVVYAAARDMSDKSLQLFFGTVLLLVIDVATKTIVLYPILAKVFS